MARPQFHHSAQLSFLHPNTSRKEALLNELALKNRILTAEPIPREQAVSADRFRLAVNIAAPGQWRRSEVEVILELTENWGWGGVLDLERLREIEQLLDAVAGGAS